MDDKSAMAEALKRAIEIIGGLTATGRGCNIRPQAVAQWEICPAARVLQIEKLTGGSISRHDLRADLYPREEAVDA